MRSIAYSSRHIYGLPHVLPVLAGRCLDRRIADRPSFERQVAAWVARRNTHNVKAVRHFTTADARVKLKSLYPAL